MSKLTLRSDRVNELVAAANSLGAHADPIGPHRPNSNKAERSILTFSDLLRIHFLQSGFAQCFRPLLAVLVCQLYNLFTVIKRLDTDSQPFLSTPYKLRHGADSVQVDLKGVPMPGQLLSFVPPAVNIDAFQRIGPRGVDCAFGDFVEN